MARTVLVVDDHAGFRAQARILLAAAGFDVVGEAGDAAEGLTAARRLRPHVVLLDIQLPDGNGFEVARALLDDRNPPAVVLVSSRERSDYGTPVTRSRARGFISKADLSAQAVAALLEGV
ncbi:MAG: response regulator [Actinomycetota bacterium]